MSKIEGITPGKKYTPFEERRGKPEKHDQVSSRHYSQKQKAAFVAIVSVIVLVSGWIVLARTGVLFDTTKSDAEFVTSLTEELRETSVSDQQPSQNITEQEQEVLDQVDKELFPEFH